MSEPQNLFYNEKCVPLGWHLPISCTSVPWQPPFYSLRVWLLGSHIQVTSCSVYPLVTGWFHSAVSYMLSQMIRFPPVLWLSWIILHCIYTPHFLYPFINGHLGGFHIHATLNVGCRYLFEILMSFFGIYTQKRDFWVIWLFHFLFFEENTHRAFHSGTPIYVPTNSVQEILKWPPRPCMFWDLPAHSTSTYFTSPHLTSPHLTSPAWDTRLWPHVRAAILPRYFYSPHLTFSSELPFFTSHFFAFHIIIIHSSFRVLFTVYIQTCVLWLFLYFK